MSVINTEPLPNPPEKKPRRIAKEVAEADFYRFAAVARLRLDRISDSDSRRDIEKEREQFVEEVMDGRIAVDQDGWPTVYTESEILPEVKFTNRPKVTALRAMDKAGLGEENAKMLAMMADTLRIPSAKLNSLDWVDFQNVSLVFGLFLGNRS